MKNRLLLSLLFLIITFDILPSNESNGSFYNNKLIKMLLYPFRVLWNSSRTTKIVITAGVGALFISRTSSRGWFSSLIKRNADRAFNKIDQDLNTLQVTIKQMKEELKQEKEEAEKKISLNKSLDDALYNALKGKKIEQKEERSRIDHSKLFDNHCNFINHAKEAKQIIFNIQKTQAMPLLKINFLLDPNNRRRFTNQVKSLNNAIIEFGELVKDFNTIK